LAVNHRLQLKLFYHLHINLQKKTSSNSKALQSCFSVLVVFHDNCVVDVSDACLNVLLSPVDSSSQLTSEQQQQQQQQQHQHHHRHWTPTPTPSDDSATPISATGSALSSPKDTSVMDSGKSTMWLGTEDGW